MSEPFVPEEVGQRIREARKAAKMTQAQLGGHVGISAGAVAHLEAGRRDTPASRLASIAAILNLDLSDLFAPSAGPSVPGQQEDAA